MGSLDRRLRLLIRAMALVLAAALVALLVTLGLYLAGDEAALADGTSRWASRAGDAGARVAFWLAVALSAGAVLALLAAARSGRLRTALGAVAVGGLAFAATALTFAEFTAV